MTQWVLWSVEGGRELVAASMSARCEGLRRHEGGRFNSLHLLEDEVHADVDELQQPQAERAPVHAPAEADEGEEQLVRAGLWPARGVERVARLVVGEAVLVDEVRARAISSSLILIFVARVCGVIRRDAFCSVCRFLS
mgnify:CR=1 FL=1